MAQVFKARVEFEGLDEAAKGLDKVEKEAKGAARATGQYEKSTKKASKTTTKASKGFKGVSRQSRAAGRGMGQVVNEGTELIRGVGVINPQLNRMSNNLAGAGNAAFQLGAAIGPVGVGIGLLIGSLPILIEQFTDFGEEAENATKEVDEFNISLRESLDIAAEWVKFIEDEADLRSRINDIMKAIEQGEIITLSAAEKMKFMQEQQAKVFNLQNEVERIEASRRPNREALLDQAREELAIAQLKLETIRGLPALSERERKEREKQQKEEREREEEAERRKKELIESQNNRLDEQFQKRKRQASLDIRKDIAAGDIEGAQARLQEFRNNTRESRKSTLDFEEAVFKLEQTVKRAAEAASDRSFKRFGEQFKEAADDVRSSGESIEGSLGEVQKNLNGIVTSGAEDALSRHNDLISSAGTAQFGFFDSLNSVNDQLKQQLDNVNKLIDGYRKAGEEVPEDLLKLRDNLKQATSDTKENEDATRKQAAAWIETGAGVGAAATQMAEELGASAKAIAIVQAVLETARGIADLAQGTWPPNPQAIAAAASHFAAAATYGAVAGKSGGGKGGGKATAAAAAQAPSKQRKAEAQKTVIINLNQPVPIEDVDRQIKQAGASGRSAVEED